MPPSTISQIRPSAAPAHPKEFATWSASPHASALASLEDRVAVGEADSVKCHETGFGQPGGFTASVAAASHSDLEKPFNFQTLADTVRQTLARTSKGHLTGISLLGFLQLLNFEKKSCTLTVTSGDRSGRIHVSEGELINADLERLQGESAIFSILSWDDCEIEISVPQHVERLIHRPLHGVILEAARDLDESRGSELAESTAAAAPATREEGDLRHELLLELSELLERPSLKIAGAIGVALVDVQQGEVVGYRCFQYWPDFAERALAGVASVHRRLDHDDGEQVEEVLITLEALLELWRPLGHERRMVFYLLMTHMA